MLVTVTYMIVLVRSVVPLKLRPYGAIQICLLLLLLDNMISLAHVHTVPLQHINSVINSIICHYQQH